RSTASISWLPPESLSSDFRGRIWGRCVSYFTLRACPKKMGSQCSATARGWSLFSTKFAAASLTLPTDEPSDHERGQQERDDHAHADEHIGAPRPQPPTRRLAPAVTDHDRDPHLQTGLKRQRQLIRPTAPIPDGGNSFDERQRP